jgi:hypothetical protein
MHDLNYRILSKSNTLLNIIIRDMQASGARIFSTRAEGDGWHIEFMGDESLADDPIVDVGDEVVVSGGSS